MVVRLGPPFLHHEEGPTLRERAPAYFGSGISESGFRHFTTLSLSATAKDFLFLTPIVKRMPNVTPLHCSLMYHSFALLPIFLILQQLKNRHYHNAIGSPEKMAYLGIDIF